jgi:hypothetical protein
MRFAALQGSGVADYAAAGKKAAGAAADMFAIQRKSGPDYGKLAELGIRTRSAEKQAAMNAGATVAKAGINAIANVERVRIAEQAKADIRKIKSKGRKAGGVAALGSIAAAGFLAFSDGDEKAPPTNTQAKRDLINKYTAERDAATSQRESQRTDYQPIGELQGPSAGTDNSSTDNSSTNSSSTNSSGAPSTTGASPSKATGGASSGKTTNPPSMSSRYMSTLTGAGMSKEQAAALTGHMDVESDGFRAYEEYAPNRYGTRGAGHLQWTNTPGSARRTNFETFASNKGLDPKSFEASSQFLLSEMQGNHGQHWTNGGSYDGFLQTKSIEEASRYLQNNYIRPGVPHTERRLNSARSAYQHYNPNL